jgi:hypothetical protein
MQVTANSDPKPVRVRSGNVSAERIRERLTEESICLNFPQRDRLIPQVGQVDGSHALKQP